MDMFFRKPPSYCELKQKLYEYNRNYSHVKLFSVGESVLGRKLYALGIGNLKNAMLYTGATHGQEWLTTLVLLRFFEDLSRCYQEKRPFHDVDLDEIFVERGFILLPMVNPDGVEIAIHGAASAGRLQHYVESIQENTRRSWQANARGVDINHNFDAGFSLLKEMEVKNGITCPGPRQYGGIRPHSEPETRALVNLCIGLDVQKTIAFHSQGEEIYYHYGPNTPKNAVLLADALAVASGYTAAHPDGMASHGGFKDWFIEKRKRCGFTIEIGKGENPLPIEDLEPIYDKIGEMMLIGLLL